MKIKIKEVKQIVEESTESLRAWAYQDQQVVITALYKRIMDRLDEVKEEKKQNKR